MEVSWSADAKLAFLYRNTAEIERQIGHRALSRRRFVTGLQHRTVGGRHVCGEVSRQRCTAAASPPTARTRRNPLASSRPLRNGPPRLMVDYQFLGMVAAVLALVTRGAVLPVLVMTAVIALVTLAYEAGTRRHRGAAGSAAAGSSPPSDDELNRWMDVVERALRSTD